MPISYSVTAVVYALGYVSISHRQCRHHHYSRRHRHHHRCRSCYSPHRRYRSFRIFFYLIPVSSYNLFRSLLRVWMRSGNDGIRL